MLGSEARRASLVRVSSMADTVHGTHGASRAVGSVSRLPLGERDHIPPRCAATAPKRRWARCPDKRLVDWEGKLTTEVGARLGVSGGDREILVGASGGLCWICGRPERAKGRSLAIDHDHRTMHVRGMLCTSCNRRLGGTTNPEWLRRAADYLEIASGAFEHWCGSCRRPAPPRHAGTCCGSFRNAGRIGPVNPFDDPMPSPVPRQGPIDATEQTS